MEILSIESEGVKAKAVEILKKKGVIAFPTDTLYAIGIDATDKKSVNKIFNLKKRKKDQPLSVMVSDFKMLEKYAVLSEKEMKIAKELLPGPITLLLKPKGLAKELSPTGLVGFRMSAGFAGEVIKLLGIPITCTSVNVSGKDACKTIQECFQQFGEKINFYINAGELISDPSTVVDPQKLSIIRQGEGLEKAEKTLSLYGKVNKKQQGVKMVDKTKGTAITSIPYEPVAKNVFIISLLFSMLLLVYKFFAFVVGMAMNIASGAAMPALDPMSFVTRLLAILVMPIQFAIMSIIVVQLYNLLQDRIGPIQVRLK